MDDFKKRNTTGMNYLKDKLAAASLKMGMSGGDIPDIDIAVTKGTNRDRLPPKEKHYQTLKFACSRGTRQELLYTVNQVAEVIRREEEWVRVLKALIVFHRLMRELDQSFTDELVNYMEKTRQRGLLNLDNFKDSATVDAWDFSAFIRVYSRYLHERTEVAHPPLKYDPEHDVPTKSSTLRTMPTNELLENLPKVMRLLTALLGVLPAGQAQYDPAVQVAMLMVIKESFKIYKTIQEGILNLLDKFFEMEQQDASKALIIYKDFTLLFDRLNNYYRSCKQLMPSGVAFPELTPLPSDLLQQMQEYVKEAKQGQPEVVKMAPSAKPLAGKLEGNVPAPAPQPLRVNPPPSGAGPSSSAPVVAPVAAPAPQPTLIDLLGDLDFGPGPSAPAPAPVPAVPAPAPAASNPFGAPAAPAPQSAPVHATPIDDPFASFGSSAPAPAVHPFGQAYGAPSSAAAIQQLAAPASAPVEDPFALAYGGGSTGYGAPQAAAVSTNPFEQAFIPAAAPAYPAKLGAQQQKPVSRDPFGALPGSGFNAPPPAQPPVAMKARPPSPVQPNPFGADPFGSDPFGRH